MKNCTFLAPSQPSAWGSFSLEAFLKFPNRPGTLWLHHQIKLKLLVFGKQLHLKYKLLIRKYHYINKNDSEIPYRYTWVFISRFALVLQTEYIHKCFEDNEKYFFDLVCRNICLVMYTISNSNYIFQNIKY